MTKKEVKEWFKNKLHSCQIGYDEFFIYFFYNKNFERKKKLSSICGKNDINIKYIFTTPEQFEYDLDNNLYFQIDIEEFKKSSIHKWYRGTVRCNENIWNFIYNNYKGTDIEELLMETIFEEWSNFNQYV